MASPPRGREPVSPRIRAYTDDGALFEEGEIDASPTAKMPLQPFGGR